VVVLQKAVSLQMEIQSLGPRWEMQWSCQSPAIGAVRQQKTLIPTTPLTRQEQHENGTTQRKKKMQDRVQT
jgi:hypothetical protein